MSVGRKPDSLRSDSGFRIIDRANDFINAGFIRPVLSDLFLLLPDKKDYLYVDSYNLLLEGHITIIRRWFKTFKLVSSHLVLIVKVYKVIGFGL
ncbi:hypothetical protein D3C71_263110 [compost metagenome]